MPDRCACPCHLDPACIAAELERELDDQDAVLRLRVREASRDVQDAADWRAIAAAPTRNELHERRGAFA